MQFDFKSFEQKLADMKVYDTWQYVKSLQETIKYMEFSHEFLNRVYENRKKQLADYSTLKLSEAKNNKHTSVMEQDLHCTDVEILGMQIDDTMLLSKTLIEFFHYARVSIDILFQIINAGLFGDRGYQVTDKNLIKNVNKKLKENSNFTVLSELLNSLEKNENYKYLRAFDNYIKHIKTILITVRNSFIFGDFNEFSIKEFVYNGKTYKEEDAINKINEVNEYVKKTLENILFEINSQIENCLDNSKRIHSINYFGVKYLNRYVSASGNYIVFFIKVNNDISELPKEIKVFPLIQRPDGTIQTSDFRFNKIFIIKSEMDENDKIDGIHEDNIVGYAELKNGLDTNETYRVFTVKSCDKEEYHKYLYSFKEKYSKECINLGAMEGSIIICLD